MKIYNCYIDKILSNVFSVQILKICIFKGKFYCFTVLFFNLLIILLPARAQNNKEYVLKMTNEKIKIDGILNEDIWNDLPKAVDFTQTLPQPGKISQYKTEVMICSDHQSIYVAAKMYQQKKQTAVMLTERDNANNINADVFGIYLDTYNDHQNGYVFKVTSAGVQQDERLSNGNEYGDKAWDAVWNSSVKIYDSFWVAEIEIPYTALRFFSDSNMVWGLNLYRLMRKTNESSYWNEVNPQQNGFLFQTGLLKGFDKINTPIRLFLFPYFSTGYAENPFVQPTQKQWLRSGGMDIKYGINDAFTLDATLVPDFSQVISDNIIRNLSPFEQQLTENRPFFTEGTELFNKSDIFYSRRIGAKPSGYNNVQNLYGNNDSFEIIKNPNVATLYNAIKLSGRNENNTGIAVFNSLVKPMYATIKNTQNDSIFKVKTSSLTNYNLFTIDKPLNGRSYIHFANSNTVRDDKERDANVSSLTVNLFDKKSIYNFAFRNSVSWINDQKDKWGTNTKISTAKISGRLLGEYIFTYLSPKYDKQDMGIQLDKNMSTHTLNLAWNENKPKYKWLQLYRLTVSNNLVYNAQPYVFRHYNFNTNLFLLLKNFWDITFTIESMPFAPVDYYQLGSFNKKMKQLPYLYGGINGSSDSRKKWFWAFGSGYGISNISSATYFYLEQSIRYQFNQHLESTISINYTKDNSNIGYAYYDEILAQPVVGKRNVTQTEGQFIIKYNFSPIMNVSARFRHYHSLLKNSSFHTTDSYGNWINNQIEFKEGLDENFNLQNIDIFFNWIFKPGNRVVLSYKQWLGDAYILNNYSNQSYIGNVYKIIQSKHAFELAARIIFYLDYSQVKHKLKK